MTDPRRTLGALALAAALALGGAGCGEDAEPAAPVGDELVGSVAQLVQCKDWNGADQEEKLATIDDVREQVSIKDGTGQTPELSDEVTMELFDNTCANDYAETFRLYKVYARATAFAGFTEQ